MTKEKKEEEHSVASVIKGIFKSVKDSHSSYVLEGLLIDATSENKSIRLAAIVKLKRDFPEEYEEIKDELLGE